jgi:hypothetical protein
MTLALCLASATALPQSLGDAAQRQAKKRSERSPTATKVYTDTDLRSDAGETAVADTKAVSSAESEPPGGVPTVASPTGRDPAPDDPVRAQLDREAEQRKQQELAWRQRARQARARMDAAKREHDLACGPGVLVLTGG